jgi:hypothetical protein
MNPSRRGFLFGLVAAAVATKLPDLSVLEQKAVADDLTDQLRKLTINDEALSNLNITDVGNGWFKVASTFDHKGGEMRLGIEPAWRDPDGLFVGDDKACKDYVERNPERVAFNAMQFGMDDGTYTFSIYYKPKTKGVYFPQLEHEAPATKYIETRSKGKA